MGNIVASSIVACFRPLIDLFCYIYDQVRKVFLLSSIFHEDNSLLLDKDFANSNLNLEGISVISKDICAIAQSTEASMRQNRSAVPPQSLVVNNEANDVILNKFPNNRSTEINELRTKDGVIGERDLRLDSIKVREIRPSKSHLQLDLKKRESAGVFENAKAYNKSNNANESQISNDLNVQRDLPTVSAQNGVSKLNIPSNSPSQFVMLSEESGGVIRSDTISGVNITKCNEKSQKMTSIFNGNCSGTDSRQSNSTKICRYSLKPLHSKTEIMPNSNGTTNRISHCTEASSSVKDNGVSYIDDVFHNEGSNHNKSTVNGESLAKNNANSLSPFHSEDGGLSDKSKLQIQQILLCFDKSRSEKEKASNFDGFQVKLCDTNIIAGNRISLENNELRRRRLGKNYGRSASLECSKTIEELPAVSSSASRKEQNIGNVTNQRDMKSQVLNTCNKHNIRRRSLPASISTDVHEIAKESGTTNPFSNTPDSRIVVRKLGRVMSFPDLQCGGLVIYESSSHHISLPNIYAENQIVINEPLSNLNFPPIASSDNLRYRSDRTLCRSMSGGGLVEVNESKKVSLPHLISESCNFEKWEESSDYVCMSGGKLSASKETDFI